MVTSDIWNNLNIYAKSISVIIISSTALDIMSIQSINDISALMIVFVCIVLNFICAIVNAKYIKPTNSSYSIAWCIGLIFSVGGVFVYWCYAHFIKMKNNFWQSENK